MKKTLKIARNLGILILVGIAQSACTGLNHTFDLTKPIGLNTDPPPGPAAYRQGWSDGCESGIAATNNQVQQFFGTHTYKIDTRMPQSSLYYRAWRYGYDHCAYSMKAILRYNI